MTQTDPPAPRIRLRIRFDGPPGSQAMIGPGRAELLERIAMTGSISAAGRAMGMSYKRAWSLVEVLNGAFHAPLIESSRGGSGGGGAHLTITGQLVLGHYRAVETAALQHGAADLAALQALLRKTGDADMYGQK